MRDIVLKNACDTLFAVIARMCQKICSKCNLYTIEMIYVGSIPYQSRLNPCNSSIQDQKVLKKGSIQINHDVTSWGTFQSNAKPMIIRFKPPTPFEMDWSWLDHLHQIYIKISSISIALSKASLRKTMHVVASVHLSYDEFVIRSDLLVLRSLGYILIKKIILHHHVPPMNHLF